MSEVPHYTPPEARVEYDQANKEEQIERFKALRDLFEGSYFDLYENMYKYADKVDIAGNDSDSKWRLFNEVSNANHVMKDSINYYLQTMKRGSGAEHSQEESQLALDITIGNAADHHLADTENGQLEVGRLTAMFSWALQSAVIMGEKFGRPVEINEADIPAYVEDMAAILTKANQFR